MLQEPRQSSQAMQKLMENEDASAALAGPLDALSQRWEDMNNKTEAEKAKAVKVCSSFLSVTLF